MISKLLIANRGEIACRVISTARKLGIATVAVYSDADAGALHVEMADEAVRIGPAPVSESYLRGAAVIQAALDAGAEAIHPGYGFLSENPGFAQAVADAGLTFVGPPPDAIRAMGLKDAAKTLMQKASVPVVPGYHGDSQDPDLLAAEAEKIGYPVLIKARAGGGGKGMRLVENSTNFLSDLEAAQREAQASFGDAHCLIEKYITQPRHIEIQVMADAHGNVVHLFERDCSLQRRHQKVIEEAPAPGMPEEVRAAMGNAATQAARAIGYVGAGTVEFIVDGSGGLREGGFWFMEMNTRLQVEHPVTEAITGLDLVALQLRVASGEALQFAQDDLAIDGHAFEARLYAEDPENGFLPATGTLHHLAFPDGAAFKQAATRIDSGVRTGDAISPFYDPMIAKVITHAPDRETALRGLKTALEQGEIAGLTTNNAFLIALCEHQEFAAGTMDTGLIGRDQDALTLGLKCPPRILAIGALAALGLLDPPDPNDPWTALRGFRISGAAQHSVDLICDGDRITHTVEIDKGSTRVNGVEISYAQTRPPRWDITYDGRRRRVAVIRSGNLITVIQGGRGYLLSVPDPLAGQSGAGEAEDAILSPMPGKVTAVMVAEGATVSEGDALIVVEAMKMEHTLTAPRDGVIAQLLASPDAQVEGGSLLIKLEPESQDNADD